MPQPAYTQAGADAQVISQAIQEFGDNFASMWKLRMQQQLEQKRLDLSSLDKVKTFMSLPAEKRQILLKDPNFASDMIRTIDPESFATKKKAKATMADTEGMASRTAAVMALGNPTTDEILAREKAGAEAQGAQAEAQMKTLKSNLATGVTTPTPMNLLGAFDMKDPFATSLMIGMNADPKMKDLVTNLALAEKKGGPIYQQQQAQDWYKWGIDQGFSPALAMKTAQSVSQGKWDEVPTSYTDGNGRVVPVRGKAEQQLAIDTANAVSRANEVQNTIESSIAQSSVALAKDAGIPIDQARSDIKALRAGTPLPYKTPNIEKIAQADLVLKGQEIEKNANTILNDKYGINTIQSSLQALISAEKEQSGSNAKDTKQKIDAMTQDLASRLAGRYGVQYPEYSSWEDTVKRAVIGGWQSMAATGAYAADTVNNINQALKEGEKPGSELTGSRMQYELGTSPTQTQHTPEQLSTLSSMYGIVANAINDPNVSADKKKEYQSFLNDYLEPAYHDPNKFNALLTAPIPQQ